MNPLIREWIEKAEGDFVVAGRELRARKSLNYDAVCFHAQQCAEKYIKANNQFIPKIHYLLELLALVLRFDSSYEFLKSDLEMLDQYSVRFRYPGEFAEKDEARTAYQAVKIVREFTRHKLGIS